MKHISLLFTIALFMVFSHFALGQSGKKGTAKKGSPTSQNSSDSNWGIGARLGDPSGITIKKYNGNKALELNIGRTHTFGYGRRWYNDRFNDYYKKQKYNYSEFQYIGYDASFPLGIQLHYLIHKKLAGDGGDMSGLLVYYGAGGQLKYQSFYYDYRYKRPGDSKWYYASRERAANFDIGLDGVLGLEYKFTEVPISVFMDGTLFMEVADDPFLFWLQGGLGVRYNF